MGQQNVVSDDLLAGIDRALVIEDYPDYFAGPSVLVTAYRPDPSLWSEDFRSRRS
jgi:hypothetical protein